MSNSKWNLEPNSKFQVSSRTYLWKWFSNFWNLESIPHILEPKLVPSSVLNSIMEPCSPLIIKAVKKWNITLTKHLKQDRKVFRDGFLSIHASTGKVRAMLTGPYLIGKQSFMSSYENTIIVPVASRPTPSLGQIIHVSSEKSIILSFLISILSDKKIDSQRGTRRAYLAFS